MLKKLSGEKTGFKALSTVMTGPVGIAIAAVVAGAVLICKNWDKIAPIIDKIVGKFKAFWERVQPQLQPFFDMIEKIATFVKDVFQKAFSASFEAISDGFVKWLKGVSKVIDDALGLFESIITFLNDVFAGNWEKAWMGLKDIVGKAFGMLADMVKTPINAVIAIVNSAIEKINGIHFTVPEWVPGIGGKGWDGLNIPTIPSLGIGTDSWRGGIVQVHERGGEIIDLPQGSRVYPHDESVRMARAESKRNIAVTIAKLADQIIVREEADIDRIAEALVTKLEQTEYNMA